VVFNSFAVLSERYQLIIAKIQFKFKFHKDTPMTTPSHDVYQKLTALNITLPPIAIPADPLKPAPGAGSG
jgi:hypothetical protein